MSVSSFNKTTRQVVHGTVNACLSPLVSLHLKHIVTIEGLGNCASPHPVQLAVAEGGGSQCGFCTPGIVMSLYEIMRHGNASQEEIEEGLDGNLCRCTGYRPILEGAKKVLSFLWLIASLRVARHHAMAISKI